MDKLIAVDLVSKIDCFDVLLDQLKTIDISQVSYDVMSKIDIVFEKLSHLTSFWNVQCENGYFQYKIAESLWGNEHLLRYIFEDCITYGNINSNYAVLYCIVCKDTFNSNHENLVGHLTSNTHLSMYNEFKADQSSRLWQNFELYKHAFEKFIVLRNDSTLFCKICATVLPMTHIHLLGHVNGREHYEKFKHMTSYRFGVSKADDSWVPVPTNTLDKLSRPVNQVTEKIEDFGGIFTNQRCNERNACVKIKEPIYNDAVQQKKDEKEVTNEVVTCSFVSQHVSNSNGMQYVKEYVSRLKNISIPIAPDKDTIRHTTVNGEDIQSDDRRANLGMLKWDAAITKHNEFMSALNLNHESNMKYFCQLCCVFDFCDGFEMINNHLHSVQHKKFLRLRKQYDSYDSYGSYDWKYCEVCDTNMFCEETFFNWHEKYFVHLKLKSSQNLQSPKNVEKESQLYWFTKTCIKSLESWQSKNVYVNLINPSFCYPCNFHTSDVGVWRNHMVDHDLNRSTLPNCRLRTCTCLLKMFCDETFYEMHIKSPVHHKIITLKSESNFENKNLKKSKSVDRTDFLVRNLNYLLRALKMKILANPAMNCPVFAFYCQPCNYYVSREPKWKSHVDDFRHKSILKKNNISSVENFKCDCKISMFCCKAFFSDHKKTTVHKNLMKLFSNIEMKGAAASNGSATSNGIPKVRVQDASNDVNNSTQVLSDDVKETDLQYFLTCVSKLEKSLKLKNESKKLKRKSAFYCYPCNFFETNVSKWNLHISMNKNHRKNTRLESCKFFTCPCNVNILSNDSFWKTHKESTVHSEMITLNVIDPSISLLSNGLTRLSHNLSKIMKDETINDEYVCAFFCQPCQYFVIGKSIWESHNIEERHGRILDLDFNSDMMQIKCSCYTLMICNSMMLNYHKKTDIHLHIESEMLRIKTSADSKGCSIKSDVSKTTKTNVLDKSDISKVSKLNNHEEGTKVQPAQNKDFSRNSGTNVTISSTECIGDVQTGITEYEDNSKTGEDICELLPDSFTTSVCADINGVVKKLELNASKENALSTLVKGKSVKISETIETDIKVAYKDCLKVIMVGSRDTVLATTDSGMDFLITNGSGCDSVEIAKIGVVLKSLKPPLFQNIVVKRNAITAKHILTNMTCNMFSDKHVVENNKLIKAYIASNLNVKNLILVVKEWARLSRISNYLSGNAINWMVFNYLIISGVLKPPSSIADIKKGLVNSFSGSPLDVTFKDDLMISKGLYLKHNDLSTIVAGFFKFYSSDKYEDNVHVPLTGELFPKSEFNDLKLKNNSKYASILRQHNVSNIRFDASKTLCLQDPFNLNNNLTSNINNVVFKKIKAHSLTMDISFGWN